MDETLLKFSNKKYFTSTDFISAYYQVKIREPDRKYTGFLYNGISYVFKRMPFGLKNSGAALIQCMDRIIHQEMGDNAVIYVDDVVIVSETLEDHFEQIKMFFKLLLQNNMRLNLFKSEFCQTEIKFLGHIINEDGIKMNPDKILAIDEIAPPLNKKLRSFLGACQYYARFCRNYALIVHPLYKLLRKNVRYHWDENCQKTFDNIKAMFYSTCTLHYPDYSRELYLQTDSSDYGLGAILFQKLDNQDKVIQLVSLAFKGPELRYTTTEKEAYAIVVALKKLKYFLAGRKFTILTDHKALTFLKQCFLLSDRMSRWLTWIQQFNFDIRYIEGSKNHLPDILSRQICKSRINQSQDIILAAIDLLIEEMPKLTWSNIMNIQESDSVLKEIKEFLVGQMNPDHPRFNYYQRNDDRWKLLNNVILIKVRKDPIIFRIFWPKYHAELLTQQVHAVYAHFGADKIYLILKDYFYWKNMHRDIRKFLAKCDICLRTKYPNRHYQGVMANIIPTDKNDLVAVDLYGPLPKARRGNKFVFLIINIFTKYTQTYPVNRPSAKVCLKHLFTYLDKVGACKRVLSDHGTQFTSGLWKNTLNEKGIQCIYSTIRHPQSNPCERVMRELSRLFRVYCKTNHRSWLELLPHINTWLNIIPHDSTGVTPHEAQFGVKPANIFSTIAHPEITQRNAVTYQIIFDRLKKSGLERIAKCKVKAYRFKVNDKVLIRTPRVSHPQLDLVHNFFHCLKDLTSSNL